MKERRRAVRWLATTTVVALTAAAALTGCSTDSGSSGKVTITLTGPNQFNADTKSFGPAWDDLVAAFEKANPDITLKTNVLPIASWNQASSAQLTAGTASELIFNQTTHKPDQVHSLSEYLDKPNPFVDGNTKWLDAFDPKFFGGDKKLGINAVGDYEYIPFNLVGIALYYNTDILKEAKVDPESLKTFSGFLKGCQAIKDAGYSPVATDSATLIHGWELAAIGSTMFDGVTSSINQFDSSGDPGTADPVTLKSIAKGVLTGDLDLTKTPQAHAALALLKKFNDACATPNWSGIQSAGAFTGADEFPGGKAAMAWGTNFAATNLADVTFNWATTTFPTISSSDSEYASGDPAQFGVSTGGTSYMIPAYIKGKQLDAAVKFLQFVSSPNVKPWLDKTGSIPALAGLEAPPGLDAFLNKTWATVPKQGLAGAYVEKPKALAAENSYEGYLLGTTSLDEALAKYQKDNVTWAKELVADNGWTGDWAK